MSQDLIKRHTFAVLHKLKVGQVDQSIYTLSDLTSHSSYKDASTLNPSMFPSQSVGDFLGIPRLDSTPAPPSPGLRVAATARFPPSTPTTPQQTSPQQTPPQQTPASPFQPSVPATPHQTVATTPQQATAPQTNPYQPTIVPQTHFSNPSLPDMPVPTVFAHLNQDDFTNAGTKFGEGRHTNRVFKATHRLTGKQVAIKSLQHTVNSQEEMQRELNNLQRLQAICKDYLVCYMGYYTTTQGSNTNYYLVTEPLGNYQQLDFFSDQRQVPFSKTELFTVWYHALAGLKLLHDNNFFHSDIKPENLLIQPVDLNIKYIDFASGCFPENYRETCQMIDVNQNYYPPEIVKAFYENGYISHDVKKAGDVYALGYTMMSLQFTDTISKYPRGNNKLQHLLSLRPNRNSDNAEFTRTFWRLMTCRDSTKRWKPEQLLKLLSYGDSQDAVIYLFQTLNPTKAQEVARLIQQNNIQKYADLTKNNLSNEFVVYYHSLTQILCPISTVFDDLKSQYEAQQTQLQAQQAIQQQIADEARRQKAAQEKLEREARQRALLEQRRRIGPTRRIAGYGSDDDEDIVAAQLFPSSPPASRRARGISRITGLPTGLERQINRQPPKKRNPRGASANIAGFF